MRTGQRWARGGGEKAERSSSSDESRRRERRFSGQAGTVQASREAGTGRSDPGRRGSVLAGLARPTYHSIRPIGVCDYARVLVPANRVARFALACSGDTPIGTVPAAAVGPSVPCISPN
jgi:hypothetical protein